MMHKHGVVLSMRWIFIFYHREKENKKHIKYCLLVIYIQSNSQKNHPKIGWFLWSHLGSNQGPPDYESGALTN